MIDAVSREDDSCNPKITAVGSLDVKKYFTLDFLLRKLIFQEILLQE